MPAQRPGHEPRPWGPPTNQRPARRVFAARPRESERTRARAELLENGTSSMRCSLFAGCGPPVADVEHCPAGGTMSRGQRCCRFSRLSVRAALLFDGPLGCRKRPRPSPGWGSALQRIAQEIARPTAMSLLAADPVLGSGLLASNDSCRDGRRSVKAVDEPAIARDPISSSVPTARGAPTPEGQRL